MNMIHPTQLVSSPKFYCRADQEPIGPSNTTAASSQSSANSNKKDEQIQLYLNHCCFQ